MEDRYLLRDVIHTLLERARRAAVTARAQRAQAKSGPATFEEGRAQAYYEVLSTLLGQLDAFQIPRDQVGVPADLNLEKELL